MKSLQQIVDLITKSMPREILAFIVDQDILMYTICGYSIEYIAKACEVTSEYVINTNNRWFGFDGWEKNVETNPEHSTEFMDYINSVYLSMVKKVDSYYERN